MRQLAPLHWPTLAGNLLMLQDNGMLKRGVWFETYAGNTALWSLSYEWWFYMLFFPLFVGLWNRPGVQKYAAFALSVAGFAAYQLHPNEPCLILGYFSIWWAGVELSREYCTTGRITFSRQLPSLLLLLLLSLLWGGPVAFARFHHRPLQYGFDPVLQFRHASTAAGFLAAALLWNHFKFGGFDLLFRPFALIAPITYSIYIFHFPAFKIAEDLLPTAPHVVRIAVALLFLVPICYLIEVILQRRINRWSDRFLPPRSPRRRIAGGGQPAHPQSAFETPHAV
jgi:peptidoglycan/LPS O-acetylase OafA/YrhL